MQFILLLTLLLLLCSHLPAFWPCVTAVRQRRPPRSIDLAAFSVLLFFDLELAFETFGGHYESDFLRPLAKSEDVIWFLILLIAPWAVRLGYWWALDVRPLPILREIPRLVRPKSFYTLAFVMAAGLCAFSIPLISGDGFIRAARVGFAESLGPAIIVFYIPMGILGFWVTQLESGTKRGKVFTFFLMLAAIVAAAPVGERTLLLVPVVIVVMFAGRPSLRKFSTAAVLLVISAALLLTLTKNLESGGFSIVFNTDLARGPALASAIENSPPVGSRLMPYPGAGYVYSTLLYVPRSLAPFKGSSSTTQFTAKLDHTEPINTRWNLAFGAIDELTLNFGWLFVPFGLFLYGCAFAFLDRIALRMPVLRVPVTLSAIWLMGYDTAALLLTFGSVALFGGVCQWWLTRKERLIPGTLVPYSQLLTVIRSRS